MTKRRAKNTIYLVIAGVVAVVLVAILLSMTPSGGWLYGAIRAAALLGYLAIFVAILSSLYMPELVRFFGRSFVATHHIIAITGLVLITLHPLSVAIAYQTWRVVLPRLGSWQSFLEWAGPPAWDLLAIATLVAIWRRKVPAWKTVHFLTYLAFIMGTIHGVLIGTDLQSGIARWVAILMAVAVIGTFVKKRLPRRAK